MKKNPRKNPRIIIASATHSCLYMPMGGYRYACSLLSSALVMMDDLPEGRAGLAPSGELARPGEGGSWFL